MIFVEQRVLCVRIRGWDCFRLPLPVRLCINTLSTAAIAATVVSPALDTIGGELPTFFTVRWNLPT